MGVPKAHFWMDSTHWNLPKDVPNYLYFTLKFKISKMIRFSKICTASEFCRAFMGFVRKFFKKHFWPKFVEIPICSWFRTLLTNSRQFLCSYVLRIDCSLFALMVLANLECFELWNTEKWYSYFLKMGIFYNFGRNSRLWQIWNGLNWSSKFVFLFLNLKWVEIVPCLFHANLKRNWNSCVGFI